MRVSVKILQGAECNVDILAADSVEHLKQLVQVPLITHCAQWPRDSYLTSDNGLKVQYVRN